MGELIGITGAIGNGKTTFADCLTKVEPSHAKYETWHIVAEIANAFNKALKAELGYETAKDNIELANQVLIWLPEAISEHLHHDVVWNQLAFNKHNSLARPELYEKLFAYLDLVKQQPNIPNQELTASNKEGYRRLLQWLGNYLVVKISKTVWYDELFRRIEIHDSDKSLVVICGVRYLSDAEAVRAHGGRVISIERPGFKNVNGDPTEAQRRNIKPDIKVINNGRTTDLKLAAETVWNDIRAGLPKAVYKAA